ncbi:MAG: glycosyltransferase family 2 protein [Planctomycetota bacterium]|jgi:glycosyltransferase involved in cell wall biosynthesis
MGCNWRINKNNYRKNSRIAKFDTGKFMGSSENDKKKIRVSVVIPAYNAEACIERAVDSVLAQSLPVHEIIVVDDGSSDKTCQVVEQFGDKVVLILQANAGVSVARNTGIKVAKGNWIAFLDADDEWLPEKNARQMEIIKQNPDLQWCAANSQTSLDSNCSVLGNKRAITKALNNQNCFSNYFAAITVCHCPMHTPTMMVRKDVFDEAGLFESGRQRTEDLDLWWRIAFLHPKIGYIAEPQVTVHLEAHDESLTVLRLKEKRGLEIRELVARYLPRADELGVGDIFQKFAGQILQRRLKTMLFNGFGEDARETLRDFKELFSWYVRWGGYMLALFPRTTSAVMWGISWLKQATGLKKQVTRRYVRSEAKKHMSEES